MASTHAAEGRAFDTPSPKKVERRGATLSWASPSSPPVLPKDTRPDATPPDDRKRRRRQLPEPSPVRRTLRSFIALVSLDHRQVIGIPVSNRSTRQLHQSEAVSRFSVSRHSTLQIKPSNPAGPVTRLVTSPEALTDCGVTAAYIASLATQRALIAGISGIRRRVSQSSPQKHAAPTHSETTGLPGLSSPGRRRRRRWRRRRRRRRPGRGGPEIGPIYEQPRRPDVS